MKERKFNKWENSLLEMKKELLKQYENAECMADTLDEEIERKDNIDNIILAINKALKIEEEDTHAEFHERIGFTPKNKGVDINNSYPEKTEENVTLTFFKYNIKYTTHSIEEIRKLANDKTITVVSVEYDGAEFSTIDDMLKYRKRIILSSYFMNKYNYTQEKTAFYILTNEEVNKECKQIAKELLNLLQHKKYRWALEKTYNLHFMENKLIAYYYGAYEDEE